MTGGQHPAVAEVDTAQTRYPTDMRPARIVGWSRGGALGRRRVEEQRFRGSAADHREREEEPAAHGYPDGRAHSVRRRRPKPLRGALKRQAGVGIPRRRSSARRAGAGRPSAAAGPRAAAREPAAGPARADRSGSSRSRPRRRRRRPSSSVSASSGLLPVLDARHVDARVGLDAVEQAVVVVVACRRRRPARRRRSPAGRGCAAAAQLSRPSSSASRSRSMPMRVPEPGGAQV